MNKVNNRVQLIGYLGKDPEVSLFEGGNKVATFSLATSESYVKKDGEKVEDTHWHRIKVWNGLANLAEQYLFKGSKILLEGKITYSSYKDKEGRLRNTTEIIGREIMFLNEKSKVAKAMA